MRDGKYVIIHVDDSMTARAMVRDLLTRAGYEVYSADDAQDLEQRLLADQGLIKSVDLFVLDMEMPDMMGAQVAATIDIVYDELSRVPFVIFSGKPREWVEQKSAEVASVSERFNKNYRGFVQKGFGSEEMLLELIKEVLASGRA